MDTLIKTAHRTLRSRQFWIFATIGVLNTFLDFVLLNILTRVGWHIIAANIVSTTAALGMSYILNKKHTFPDAKTSTHHQIILFLVVTLFGLYILQNTVIWTFTEAWRTPIQLVVDTTGLNADLLFTNISKLIATSVSMVWNFVLYKKVVFNETNE